MDTNGMNLPGVVATGVTVTERNGANLMTAHREWASRPADERFNSIEELEAAVKARRARAISVKVMPGELIADTDASGELIVRGPRGGAARMTNWSFGQLSGLAGAPRGYLAGLPGRLAADNLNHGLKVRKENDQSVSVLFDKRPGMQELMVRAMTGDGYSRLWDEEVTGLAMRLQDMGWKLPLAYEGGNWGAEKKPVCFGGDRDVFVLMEDREHRVSDGTSEGMMRAVMLRNSEVGARSWQMWAAYLRDICGNLILWGVTKEIAVRLRHVGQVGPRAAVEVSRVLEGFANESPREIEEKVKRLQATRIAASVEEVVKRVREKVDIPQKTIKAAIELAEASGVDGDPLSAWGLTQGLTRLSQSAPFTDARVDQDQLAAKVLAAAW